MRWIWMRNVMFYLVFLCFSKKTTKILIKHATFRSILMDFDFHFGRFFGPQIDVFEKFLLPDFELQLEVRNAKIVILLRENAVFYKIDILALKLESMQNIKKIGKNRFKINLFFHNDFLSNQYLT